MGISRFFPDHVTKRWCICYKYLRSNFHSTPIRLDQREPYRVRVARTFISNHRADDINLADVARATHVSTFYLCKIFKKATGLTFIEYRNRLRIESAKKMLLNPNLNVSEIAYSVGFQSLTQFNRLFRRVVGMAPTRFRCQLAPEIVPS